MGILLSATKEAQAQRFMENLDRGLVAVKVNKGVFLSWRILGTEYKTTGFNVYRGSMKIASIPDNGPSNFLDSSGIISSIYTIRAVVNGAEQTESPASGVWADFYKVVLLQVPPGDSNSSGSYSPNDCSVGDLDGDGQYEIIVKWDPSNSKDNSQSGYTGNVFLDAYKLDGKHLWRIDLGKNIRAGAHYTQFMVYDLDNDGKAEVACKTAPGTRDGTGSFLKTGPAASANNSADYRNSDGYILSGPEYLTIFNGQTGNELITVDYKPPRGILKNWGDEYGNRVDRFLACIAYLDGVNPSLVMCRGYYTRSTLWALDWRDSKLTEKWFFDADISVNYQYQGQGCHSIRVGDVDSDGYDEIVYGACTIDHNGEGLYSTGLGHGDALHLSDMDPDRPGLEVWQVHEGAAGNGKVAASFRDARTGQILWTTAGADDNGRGMAAPLVIGKKGWQMWSSAGGLFDLTNTKAGTVPSSDNFGIWWDGDEYRETVTGTKLDKYGSGRLVTFSNYESATSCNGTKDTPNLQADIFGDWREEYIMHSSDNTKLIIFTTNISTDRRMYTLMHDPVYRLSVASENVAYNQPPEPGIYIGFGMAQPSVPNIKLVGSTPISGVHNVKKINHSIGNNPSTISVQFDKPGANVKVEMFTINGKKIRCCQARSGSNGYVKLPVSNLNEGSYLLKTSIDEYSTIHKINIVR
jgi:rhamnogalacturonan endolyase